MRHRLYREDCTFRRGAYLKDLELLGRDLTQTILVDNSPLSIAQPENAILCSRCVNGSNILYSVVNPTRRSPLLIGRPSLTASSTNLLTLSST